MQKTKGYVYILTNPSFREDWVKIGKSSREVDIRSKELDNTAVPLPFEIYATVKTSQYEKLEKQMHKILTDLADKRIRKGREFFNIKPKEAFDYMKGFSEMLDDAELNFPDDITDNESEDNKKTFKKKGKYIVDVSSDVEFYFARDSVDATMIVKDGKLHDKKRYVVKQGSRIDSNIYSNDDGVKRLRDKNVVFLKGDITTKDIEFSSPSSAGEFVCGGSCNGKYYWRTKEGRPLNDFIKYNNQKC